jgi:hypothetical protein
MAKLLRIAGTPGLPGARIELGPQDASPRNVWPVRAWARPALAATTLLPGAFIRLGPQEVPPKLVQKARAWVALRVQDVGLPVAAPSTLVHAPRVPASRPWAAKAWGRLAAADAPLPGAYAPLIAADRPVQVVHRALAWTRAMTADVPLPVAPAVTIVDAAASVAARLWDRKAWARQQRGDVALPVSAVITAVVDAPMVAPPRPWPIRAWVRVREWVEEWVGPTGSVGPPEAWVRVAARISGVAVRTRPTMVAVTARPDEAAASERPDTVDVAPRPDEVDS